MSYTGSCYCKEIQYELALNSPEEEARTSICYCENCKRWTGSAFGITIKVPRESFRITKGNTAKHVSANNNSRLFREFCGACGSGILEYGEQAMDKFRYITYGSIDQPDMFPPKGEFFCKYKESWMPEVPDVFHKQEIKN
ncbi:hypothetical protein Agabi119p4_7181 [Agaricus bisporus var. burnettii]|uniref:CENP-V/GFA domain-containing protein n=1 Tax=Agaricus bisporus var. burnettii TaxID=192524 RepID=A0A8H7C7M3_AGABI|nr:hypothetical protein Agabi119p4_7181 [Agaricus bisporus var. burnettii]